ncbi:MAG: nickel pincer cofactor biosynthesis protein LarC [Planctomycetales bacterium]|nr:nickel pincer cofactor biosynthesis protein LarC [Planctomycetales bacterium]
MRVAYLDCMSGVSGDMTLGAMLDCGVPLQALQAAIDSLGLPSCRLEAEEVKRHGFRAMHVRVVHEPEHAHRHLHHIVDIIDQSSLTDGQRDLAKRIFTRIGEAEARVHGTTLQKVHFHEVGAVDSIADIVGAAVGWDLLGVDRIVCSPVPTGTGFIQIEHGRVSVPAPATAELLKGVPLAPSEVRAELTTPTGAGIVTTVADEFGPLPPLVIEQIGYGAGTKELAEQANVTRLIIGDAGEQFDTDQAWMLETNLDDISGEVIGHTTARLLESGALDVYTTPVQMKKNRPGAVLSILCHAAQRDKLERIVFRETGTLGVRRWAVTRHKLDRRAFHVQTAYGEIAGKLSLLGDEQRFAPEYESCRQAAAEHNVPLRDVMEAARAAFPTE